MRKLPPLSALRAFEAAGRHGTLSLAAQELYVTHGAVSKQVKGLERSLGVQLTRRTGRGIELTPQGRHMLPYLTKAFDDLGAAVRSVHSGSFEGSLIISCMPGLAATWLIPKLAQFMDAYPNIALTVLSAVRAPGLHQDITDLEILYGRPEWPGRRVRLLRQLEIFPVCSPQVMSGPDPVRTLDDLSRHVLIDNPTGTHWQEFLLAQGKDTTAIRRTLRFQDFNHELSAARAGLGIAIGDDLTTGDDLAAGRLVRPLPEMVRRQSMAYYLVTAPERATSAAAGTFIEWLVQEMEPSQNQ
ncbi:LysR substrate-binding domain-containing protein [Roseovarius pelagicus]|uniref:LysR substrate-binding domain-containing protein n=1 Tax=Roseovarius pelagicus TaxID=2980108 RepID=A0ABY6DF18_9RHOB|nr:LysR substrate-binding domain-containing protein [Roseovarius pelagicus]UXX84742.1 LysR substrate-binding domain-containing protein [Roseovarius pelagicus]